MRAGIAAIFVVYLALAGATLLTRKPWCDEGWFASPAWNLVERGHMGTTVYVVPDTIYPRLDRLTYWMPPLHFLAQAAVFRVAGPGIFQMRFISLVSGAVLVAATFVL